jgi:hypothetical protein
VIVARYLPRTLPVQEIVDVPEPPAIELDDKLHTRLVELVVATSPTVPVNPFREPTEIVESLETPTLAEMLVWFVVIVKSCVRYCTVTLCERLLLVPLTMAR